MTQIQAIILLFGLAMQGCHLDAGPGYSRSLDKYAEIGSNVSMTEQAITLGFLGATVVAGTHLAVKCYLGRNLNSSSVSMTHNQGDHSIDRTNDGNTKVQDFGLRAVALQQPQEGLQTTNPMQESRAVMVFPTSIIPKYGRNQAGQWVLKKA